MTRTNTDYLLQVTTPVTDRTYGATGATEGAANFDDHLSQASSYSGDDSRSLDSGSQRTEMARYERHDPARNDGASQPSSHDSGSSTNSQTTPVADQQSADVVSGSNAPAESTNEDDHDAEKSDETAAAEVTGASQTATNNTKKSDLKAEPSRSSDAAATAKVAAVNKKTATGIGERKATGNAALQASNGASSSVAETQRVDETAKLAASEGTDEAKTSEEVVETQRTASDDKPSKGAKGATSAAKSNKGSSANNDGDACNDQSVGEAGTGETLSTVAIKATENVEASATVAAAAATKGKLDVDETSEDDSRTGSQHDSRAVSRNDAAAPPNKVDAAQLAGGIPSMTDAGANTSSKSKDDEHATKPIAAKGEPVAAAFARMTRNNIAGSNDSASGANDLPQVDPSRFIGRVAKAFQTAQDRGGTLQLRLSPPELGALRIELSVKDGVMSASLQTENSNARRLLLDHLPALRDRLAEQNIRVDRFDVDVRRESTGGQTDARGSQQQQFQHQSDQPAPRRHVPPQPRTPEIAAPERIAIAPSVSDAGLNLIV